MGRGWTGVVLGLLALGCTRENPAYDDGSADTAGDTQGSRTGGLDSASTSVTTSGADDVADGGPTGDDANATTTGEVAETGNACIFEAESERYEIFRGTEKELLGCELEPFQGTTFGFRVMNADMFWLFGAPCTACPCEENANVRLEFTAPLPEITGEPCLTFVRDLSEPECDLLGYSIISDGSGMAGGEQVIAAASNERAPGPGVPFEVDLILPIQECEGTCLSEDPAHYTLRVLSSEGEQVDVPPGGMQRVGELDVFNEASWVDEACTEVVRWHALLPPK